jgi:hypothetical protein
MADGVRRTSSSEAADTGRWKTVARDLHVQVIAGAWSGGETEMQVVSERHHVADGGGHACCRREVAAASAGRTSAWLIAQSTAWPEAEPLVERRGEADAVPVEQRQARWLS